MRAVLRAALMAVALLPAGLGAQEVGAQDNVGKVPSVDIAPPPAIPIAYAEAFRTSCGDEHPWVPIEANVRATFHTDRGDYADLVFCMDQYRAGYGVAVRNMDVALLIMSARVFEPFWPRAEQFWGDDMGLLRARLLDYDVDGFETPFARAFDSGETREALSRALLIDRLGQHDAATALLAGIEEQLLTERRLHRSSLDFDRNQVVLNRASLAYRAEGPQAALALLDAHAARLPAQHGYGDNLLINRAAYLAEAGMWEQSLQIIEPAYRTYRDSMETEETYHVGGSDREFSWIMACNLMRLGRVEDAEFDLKVVNTADETPPDAYIAQTKRSSQIRLRMSVCMGDQAGWEGVYLDDSMPRYSPAWLVFQQQSTELYRPLPDWVLSAELTALVDSRFRQLPASYGPALRRWRAAAASPVGDQS